MNYRLEIAKARAEYAELAHLMTDAEQEAVAEVLSWQERALAAEATLEQIARLANRPAENGAHSPSEASAGTLPPDEPLPLQGGRGEEQFAENANCPSGGEDNTGGGS